MAKRILVVEDDIAIARLLRDNLSFEGFDVQWAETGADAVRLFKNGGLDLVLLDLMLPRNVDGMALCRHFVAERNRVPIIIVSARGQKEDRVRGLTLGADDYVVKPFALDELLARINSVLRRTSPRVDRLMLGDVAIDFVRLCACNRHGEMVLTEKEYQILQCLAERAGHVVTRDELLRLVWGFSDAPLTRSVDNCIFRLRHKIEPDPHRPRYLRTAYGDGYRLTPNG